MKNCIGGNADEDHCQYIKPVDMSVFNLVVSEVFFKRRILVQVQYLHMIHTKPT